MGSPISREVFLARAKARFGDHYDYSNLIYKSYKTPIRIKCARHPVKDILITPERHLQTTGGCKFCLREVRLRILERGMAMPAAPSRELLKGKNRSGPAKAQPSPV
jgi:hypothetical protein